MIVLEYLAAFLLGGLVGSIAVALTVATKDRRMRLIGTTRTASQAQGPSSWAIAHNGDVTTDSQMGTFSVTTSPVHFALPPER